MEPILRAQGCGAGGDCHGGGIRGTFRLSPDEQPDLQYDFTQSALQVNGYHPDESALLLKPLALAAGGRPHAIKAFPSREVTDFQRLHDWAAHGVFE